MNPHLAQSSAPDDAPVAKRTGNAAVLGVLGGTFFSIVAFTSPFIFQQLRSPLPYMATPKRKIEKALKFVSSYSQNRVQHTTISVHALDVPHPQDSTVPSFIDKTNSNSSINENNTGGYHINLIGKERKAKPNFIDLGSGDGTAVLAAEELGWKSIGLEMNPTLWLISNFRKWFRVFKTRKLRKDCRFVLGDMFAICSTHHERLDDESQSSASKKNDQNGNGKGLLHEADCVMIFGVASLMPKIADLIQRECRPGCIIMSYRFRVPLFSPDEFSNKNLPKPSNTVKILTPAQKNGKKETPECSPLGGIDATMIYDEEEMRLYELNNQQL